MIKNTVNDSMENTPEITAIHPHEPGYTPEGYVKMPIPFVGIYQSLLGADIDHFIDGEIERCNDEDMPCKEIKIHYDPIYESISEYTAILLGIKGARYAGTVCPEYYNYLDDQPYLFVPKDWYIERCGEYNPCSLFVYDILCQKLRERVDDWYQHEYDPNGDYIAQAVYAEWANGLYNGYEEILENLEVIY